MLAHKILILMAYASNKCPCAGISSAARGLSFNMSLDLHPYEGTGICAH